MLVARVIPMAPPDNKCELCHNHNHKYLKNDKYVCNYCWDRMEHIEYEDKTDKELDEIRAEGLNRLQKHRGRGIINAVNIGFGDVD